MTTRREEFIEGMSYTLKDQKVQWCNLVTPDEFEGKKFWKLTIVLNSALAESMAEAGMPVKFTKDDTPLSILVVKRNCKTKKGKELAMPKVFDENGEEIDGSMVGDGSICDVNVTSRYVTVGGKEHCPTYLDSVTVKKLVVKNLGGGESPFGA